MQLHISDSFSFTNLLSFEERTASIFVFVVLYNVRDGRGAGSAVRIPDTITVDDAVSIIRATLSDGLNGYEDNAFLCVYSAEFSDDEHRDMITYPFLPCASDTTIDIMRFSDFTVGYLQSWIKRLGL